LVSLCEEVGVRRATRRMGIDMVFTSPLRSSEVLQVGPTRYRRFRLQSVRVVRMSSQPAILTLRNSVVLATRLFVRFKNRFSTRK
jgi:hypothetical protein